MPCQHEGTIQRISRSGLDGEAGALRLDDGDAPTEARDSTETPADTGETAPASQPGRPVHHVRVNNSFVGTYERKLLLWLAGRMPPAVTPNKLTLLGLAGAALALAGFAASNASPWFLSLAILGLCINWLGDSLDGTLARYRKIERPDFGYFLDHACDLISQTLIFVGLGFSPYFTLFSALLALSMYLLMTSFTYLKVLILKTHHLSYYGMGATELRLLLIGWALFALWFGPNLIDTRFMGLRCIDIIIFALASLVFIAFMWKVWSDVRRFQPTLDIEPGRLRS